MVMTDLKRNVILLAVLPICSCLIGTASLKFALAGCVLLLILFIKTSLPASDIGMSNTDKWRILDYDEFERYEQLLLNNENKRKDLFYYLLYLPISRLGIAAISFLAVYLMFYYDDMRFIYLFSIIAILIIYINVIYGSLTVEYDDRRSIILKFTNLLEQRLHGSSVFKFRLMVCLDNINFRDICVMLESNSDDRELRYAVIHGVTSSFNRAVTLDNVYMTLIFKNEMNDADRCQRAMESVRDVLMNECKFSRNLSCNIEYKSASQTGVMTIAMTPPHMMSDFTSEKNFDDLSAVIGCFFKTGGNDALAGHAALHARI